MSNAVVTGTVDFTTHEVTSTDGKPPKLVPPVTGDLLVNGVNVSLASDTVDSVVQTVNRFTPLTLVTASIQGSTVTADSSAPVKHLVLTSPNDIRLAGDTATMDALGLGGGVTQVSTEAAKPVTQPVTQPVTLVSTEKSRGSVRPSTEK